MEVHGSLDVGLEMLSNCKTVLCTLLIVSQCQECWRLDLCERKQLLMKVCQESVLRWTGIYRLLGGQFCTEASAWWMQQYLRLCHSGLRLQMAAPTSSPSAPGHPYSEPLCPYGMHPASCHHMSICECEFHGVIIKLCASGRLFERAKASSHKSSFYRQ